MKGVNRLVPLLVLTAVVGGRPPTCPRTGAAAARFLPDEADSAAFWQCAHGAVFHLRCNRGLVWNTALSICDWPADEEPADHDSRHRTGAAATSYNEEPSSQSSPRKDNGDLEERQPKRSSKRIVHELLRLYDLLQEGPEFDVRYTKRPVVDLVDKRRPVEDPRHTGTLVEDFRQVKRLLEDLKITRRLLEHLTDTKRPVEDLGHIKSPVEDDGPTKTPVDDVGRSKRPVENVEHTKTSKEDIRYTKRPVEDFKHTKRTAEGLEHKGSPEEDHESTKRRGHRKSPGDDFGHTEIPPDDPRHSKQPVKHHVDHAQLMKSIFRLMD